MPTPALPLPYERFYDELQALIPPARLIRDRLRTLAYGSDASFYRLIPKLIVKVTSEQEVAHVLKLARKHGTPLTFRAAGTSVSGQAVSDSVLVILGDGWQGYEVSADAMQIRLQPGVIGGTANRALAPFHRKIGPDPASINICTIGGIAANNSSGMCCVTAQNSYHTLLSMRLVFADGAVLDTADASSRKAFTRTHGALLAAIDALARHTRANAVLAARLRKKFEIRNTCGYSINALLDFEDPIDILQHLMIGSEGTLGFIAEITYRTVADPPHKASALVLFPDVGIACEAATRIKRSPVAAVELMDRASLRAVERKPGLPAYLAGLPEEAASLLIETRASDRSALRQQIAEIEAAIAKLPTLLPLQFTDKVDEYTRLWRIRQGLYPSVGAVRATGTTVVTEDVVFPLAALAPATLDLQQLLRRHAYAGAIILGHALEGNLHIIFTEDFGQPKAIDRYRRFMDGYTELVVHKYDGSLKGEHGTGRNMAPFVELEWGREAYELMREIKAIFDPDNVLNPGVILNDDAEVHLKNLKPLPAADPLIDKCIECGACELACPSNTLTLTPRQRIVVLRELARLQATAEDPALARELREHYRYQGIQTCAGDGLCALACPVGIDTGEMMRALRARAMGGAGRKAAGWFANHFAGTASATRALLAAANGAHALLGSTAMDTLARGVRTLSGGRLPQWNRYMPTPARLPPPSTAGAGSGTRVVYFPSCVSRTLGPARGDPEGEALPEKTESLLRKAGYTVSYPRAHEQLCCGMAFSSRGATAQADGKLHELERALLEASRNGADPIISDTSPCSLRLKQALRADLKLLDITEFIHDALLDRVSVRAQPGTVVLHATCSTRRLGLEGKLNRIAEACAEKVIVPEGIGCCGWAGETGFTVPELTASALRRLRSALPPDCTAGYSTSRTCEIGLSYHSGRYYRSIVYLVERCVRSHSTGADAAIND